MTPRPMGLARLAAGGRIAALAFAVTVAAAPGLRAQAPHEMKPEDKIELFLQHTGKIDRVDPQIFQSFLLEYELARSLGELGTPHPDPLMGDFILRALERLHPELAAAMAKLDAHEYDAARAILTELAARNGSRLAARCRLALAEIDLAQKRPEEAMKTAERIVRGERQFLIPDHRACEIIAECYRALEKPVPEYLQYAILLTDYRGLPAEVAARAKARMAAIEAETGSPVRAVATWMDTVERWIRDLETSRDPTQARQGEILVALDKMIELQEARERNTCPNCGKGG